MSNLSNRGFPTDSQIFRHNHGYLSLILGACHGTITVNFTDFSWFLSGIIMDIFH